MKLGYPGFGDLKDIAYLLKGQILIIIQLNDPALFFRKHGKSLRKHLLQLLLFDGLLGHIISRGHSVVIDNIYIPASLFDKLIKGNKVCDLHL